MNKYRQYPDEEALYTPEYAQHVQAMTAEKLHSKSEIAAELAGRDREIARLKGVKPELPLPSLDDEKLPRYGLRYNGPTEPLSTPFDDGYWTPWHLADAIRQENDRLKESLAIHQRMLAGGVLYSMEELIEHDAQVIKSNFKRLSEEYMKYPRDVFTGTEVAQNLELYGVHYAIQLRQKAQEGKSNPLN